MKYAIPAGILAFVVLLGLMLLLPFLLADAMVDALHALGLSHRHAVWLVVGIFVGGLFNIPVWRRPRAEELEYRPYSLYGIDRLMPRLIEQRRLQIVALNVGGCITSMAL